uniref:tape measure protein n=1 Tax=Prevotella sp. TaxID=59823 RepID=UPI00402A5566
MTEKLAKMRDLMSEGTQKGYSTSMLTGSVSELDNILSRLNAAKLNPTMLTDAAQMRNLISDVLVEMVKATAATQAYGREKGKVIALEKAAAEEYDRQRRQRDAAKKAQDDELKALSDYAKRYMELQEAKIKADKKASDERKRQSEEERRRIETDTARMSKLYATMSLAIGRGERAGMRSLGLGVNTSTLEKALSDATELKKRIEDANIAIMGKGGRPAYSSYVEEVNRLSSSLANATQAQRDLNSAQDKANRKAEAQAIKDAAKAKREDIAAEKQRQNELKNTERRYDSLGNKVRQLRSEYSRGISIGADVSKAEDEINRLLALMRALIYIRGELYSGNWKNILGTLGNMGSGHDTTLASRVLQDQKAVNREVQRGVELEQKRQQEIAQTAAKVQSDLVRGFERANSHAGKLNSTVQDLKSLFLQGGLVFGAQQFAMSIITTGGEMEKQHIALQSILGDMQNANTMFNQIKELALNSPFTFSELNRDVKQLAAYGVEYDQLYDTTKRLADMSSGLGVSFDRIALAFGQVQARGWLDGKELRQIAYAGIPLLEKLSEFYSKQEGRNVSTSEIKTRISNREVSFDDVKSIFWKMTDAGGQFYNMQQVLSETLLGRYNKLKDAWEIMLAEFASGDSLVGKFFKTAIDGATALVQSLHTLAMPIGAIFAGYAFKKMAAGNTASSFLSNKANLAFNIQNKVLQGQALTQIEQRILATKNQITGADLRALANAKALTTEKLNQLRLSGKITAEQYNIYRGIVLRQTGEKTVRMELLRALATMRSMSLTTTFSSLKNVWTGFQTSALAAFRVIGTGVKTLAAGIWSAIGGLPGLIVTAVTFGITYAISEYQELSQKINQTQDEIADKNKQIRDFLRDNNVNIAISGGDTKEIDNMIDSYKEKLKELAPYSYKNMLMTANEENDHKKRLQYLEQEIKLLKEANDIASAKLNNRGYYSDLSDATEDVIDAFKKREELRVAAMSSDDDSAGYKWLYDHETAYSNYIESLKNELAKRFGDIGKDEKMREAAMQAMSGIFSSMGIPEDKADIIRASILQAFGCGDKSAWLQTEVSNSMIALIDKSFPMIGEKIKASMPLNDAEKAKVKELMNDAKNGLVKQYPELEHTLQNMLAASNFQAVIRLVLDGGEKLNNLQSELVKRIPSRYSGLIMSETSGKYKTFAEKWGKEDSWYSARNAAQSDIDKAKNEYLSAKASKAKNAGELYTAWQTVKQAAKDLLYYDYEGSGKKSNKVPKGRTRNTGKLETLRKRVELYKKFYSELEKYRRMYGEEGAMAQIRHDKEFKNSVLSWGLSDPGTYGVSIEELMKRVRSSTQKRKEYKESQLADIHAKNRSIEEERIKSTNSQLSKQLNILSSQYETYKKIYELTGNSEGSSLLAFGHVQSGTYQDYLKEQMKWAIGDHNQRTGQNLSADEVLKMSESDFKKHVGDESENASVIYKEWTEETNRIKKETIDLMANLIEKNATIAQQIEDENRKYERQLELIKGIEDPQMRDRAKAGATKTHNENVAKLQFEQFKQESDWVTIFDDLDRVSSATISSMITKIDDFSRTTGLSVEVVKQLRDALDELRKEDIDRNPLPYIFGAVNQGNAIGGYLKGNLGAQYMNGKKYVPTAEQAKKMGIEWSAAGYSKNELESKQKGKYADSSYSINALAGKFKALESALDPVIGLFKAMGEEDSILGQITGGASNAVSSAANTVGAFNTLSTVKGLGFLEDVGPYAAAASAAFGIGGSLIKAFGADYSSYNKAKAEYENLTSIWDSLISKKTEYMNIHWGTEAANASKEAQEMLESEIKQTKVIAMKNFNSGASVGSHSIKVRDWKKRGWKEAAPEISKRYGVKFDNMTDILDIDYKVLQQIKKDYAELWANLDEDSRTYLDKLIEYGEKSEDMIESLTEKLTGNKYSDLVSAWGDAMATMSNTSDNLVDHFEENLRNVILKSMIENLYGEKIKALIEKTKKYGDPNGGTEKKLDTATGKVMSEYTNTEMDEIGKDLADVTKQIEASRDYLKRYYGWSDNSSSSLTNSVKGITEDTGDLIASYLNSIRLDVSVIREEQVKCMSESNEIAKSQLTQLNFISANTLRNAEAAERIERVFEEYSSNFNMVINGVKSIKVR